MLVTLQTTRSWHLPKAGGALRQVNARKIYDEPDVLGGVLENRLFLGILGGELLLQARRPGLALGRARPRARNLGHTRGPRRCRL